MPISNNEWNQGRKADSLKTKILSFLTKHSDEELPNFNLSEIIVGLDYDITSVKQGINSPKEQEFQTALADLVKEGTVEKKSVDGELYYRANKTIRLKKLEFRERPR